MADETNNSRNYCYMSKNKHIQQEITFFDNKIAYNWAAKVNRGKLYQLVFFNN